MKIRGAWRARYRVWCQAQPPSGGNEYAVLCRDCPPNMPNGEHWVTDSAGSRSEAWDTAGLHESKVHGRSITDEEGDDGV